MSIYDETKLKIPRCFVSVWSCRASTVMYPYHSENEHYEEEQKKSYDFCNDNTKKASMYQ